MNSGTTPKSGSIRDSADRRGLPDTDPHVRQDPTALLRTHGVQVTAQRIAVLRTVTAEPHGTADEIASAVRHELGAISQQAVYDSLHLLTEEGLLRRIQPAGSAARYEARVGDNHHHLTCRRCGRLVDVDCAVGEAPCLDADDAQGFVIDEAEVTYWGTCPTCAREPNPSP